MPEIMNINEVRDGEMVHWVRGLAAKPEDLSLLSGTYIVQERTNFPKLFSDLYRHTMAYTPFPNKISKLKAVI